jgi:hypothetical protein
MPLILKRSGGHNIALRDQSLPRFYESPSTEAISAQVFSRVINADGSRGQWQSVGEFGLCAKVSLPFNPAIDHNVEFAIVTYSASGVPSHSFIDDAVVATLLHQRETDAPDAAQVGDSTPTTITLSVRGFTKFAVKRKIRIAEDAGMSVNLAEEEFNSASYEREPLANVIDITRSVSISPASTGYFTLAAGADPASIGFTKTGSGATSASGGGWKIDTSTGTLDATTYYSKSSWPASAFSSGFTFERLPPTVTTQEGTPPNLSVADALDDGVHRFELTYSGTQVALNGGTAHTHSGLMVRLVIATGGATADLWIGDTKVETATASIASVASGFRFGDLAGADDSDATWQGLTYARVTAPVKLAQTIYVAISHSSGNAYGAESAPLEVTFASEITETGGSSGDGDLIIRDRFESTY